MYPCFHLGPVAVSFSKLSFQSFLHFTVGESVDTHWRLKLSVSAIKLIS